METSFTAQIPFTFDYKLPIVKTIINGKTYNFLFDSGAPTVITPALAKQLKLKALIKRKNSDSQGNSSKEEVVIIPNMKIGNLNYENTGAFVIDFKKIFELNCIGFDGIIGANQMAKSIWQIDYQNKILTTTNSISNLNIPLGTETIDFKPYGAQKTPKIEVKIGGKSSSVTFDTGAISDFNFNFNNFKSEISTFKTTEYFGNGGVGVYGTGKKISSYFVKIPSLSIGNLVLENQIVAFNNGTSEIIGNTFFKNYTVILNWQENKIYMIKEVELKSSKLEGFGISIKYINQKPTISAIYKSSAAANSGLLLNDEIIKIDELDTSNLTVAEACYYSFNNPLKEKDNAKITVIRDGKKIIFDLKKELILD